MKILLVSVILAGFLGAVEPPVTQPANRYYSLWQNSPITVKPDPPVVDEVNDLEDWVLVGLEEYASGKIATIVNKKDPKIRLRIPGTGEQEQEFSILEVQKGQGSFLDTKVILQKGKHRGEVGYESKYLVIRKAAPRPANTKKPTTSNQRKTPTPTPTPKGLPGGIKSSTKTTKNAPRVRHIPKPTK